MKKEIVMYSLILLSVSLLATLINVQETRGANIINATIEKIDIVPLNQKTVTFAVNISEYIGKTPRLVTLKIEETKDGINWQDLSSSTRDESIAFDDDGNRDDFIRLTTTLPNEDVKIRSSIVVDNTPITKDYTTVFK